jgi:hypothetical protein
MKDHDVPLKMLFAAARQAPDPSETEAMSGALKTRILAHWRSAEETAGHHLAVIIRVALGCAAAVMVASIAWSSMGLDDEDDGDVAIANYELRSDVMP